MGLNQGTQRSRLFQLTLVSCLSLLFCDGFLRGQTDTRTEKEIQTKPGRIEGVYEAKGAKLTIKWVNNDPRGEFVRNGQTFRFVGKQDGSAITGTLLNDDVNIKFVGKMEGDLLHVAAGFDRIKMRRVTGSVPAVQGKTGISETVLAQSTQVLNSTIRVSPDNSKVAFAIRGKGQRDPKILVNGKAMQSDYDLSGLRFSPNGERLAYRLLRDSKSYFVVDDQLQGPFDSVVIHPHIFSSDSKRSIFTARTDKQWRIVTDGKPGPPFDEISRTFGFSPDGQRMAYAGKRNQHWHAVVNDELSPPYDAILYGRILFSADSKHVHYTIVRDGKQIPILDGKELGAYEAIANVGFNPYGDQFAFVAIEGSSRMVITDGVAGARYDNIGKLQYSPKGTRPAYQARTNGKWRLIINGEKRGDPYDMMSAPVFSSNGNRVAVLAATNKKQFVVVDGKPSVGFDEVASVVFSPDEKQVSFIARQEKEWYVVVNGKRSYPYATKPVPVAFSSDSEHFVYTGKREGNTYIVVDGVEGKPVWNMLPGSAIVWDGPKRFHTVVRRTDTFLRLDIEIQK